MSEYYLRSPKCKQTYLLGILCHLFGGTEEKHTSGFTELDLLIRFLYATCNLITVIEKAKALVQIQLYFYSVCLVNYTKPSIHQCWWFKLGKKQPTIALVLKYKS